MINYSETTISRETIQTANDEQLPEVGAVETSAEYTAFENVLRDKLSNPEITPVEMETWLAVTLRDMLPSESLASIDNSADINTALRLILLIQQIKNESISLNEIQNPSNRLLILYPNNTIISDQELTDKLVVWKADIEGLKITSKKEIKERDETNELINGLGITILESKNIKNLRFSLTVELIKASFRNIVKLIKKESLSQEEEEAFAAVTVMFLIAGEVQRKKTDSPEAVTSTTQALLSILPRPNMIPGATDQQIITKMKILKGLLDEEALEKKQEIHQVGSGIQVEGKVVDEDVKTGSKTDAGTVEAMNDESANPILRAA